MKIKINKQIFEEVEEVSITPEERVIKILFKKNFFRDFHIPEEWVYDKDESKPSDITYYIDDDCLDHNCYEEHTVLFIYNINTQNVQLYTDDGIPIVQKQTKYRYVFIKEIDTYDFGYDRECCIDFATDHDGKIYTTDPMVPECYGTKYFNSEEDLFNEINMELEYQDMDPLDFYNPDILYTE